MFLILLKKLCLHASIGEFRSILYLSQDSQISSKNQEASTLSYLNPN